MHWRAGQVPVPSSSDKAAVRSLYKMLVTKGFRPWLDEENIMPGQDWELAVRNEVRASHVVVVLLSRNAVTRAGFVQKEIRLALDAAEERPEGSIFLITARLEECEVPDRLKRWQWVDIWKPDGYQRLLNSLGLKVKELATTVYCGLTPDEVLLLSTWRRRLPATKACRHQPARTDGGPRCSRSSPIQARRSRR
jgi:hypothetical protein